MRNFSIAPNSKHSVLKQYTNFLSKDVYRNMFPPYDVNDSRFLQQLSVLQAEVIRKAIDDNSSTIYDTSQETNSTIIESANNIGNTISSVANKITSSLDKGFDTLNYSLTQIDNKIHIANEHLSDISVKISNLNGKLEDVKDGIKNINNNLKVLGNQLGQGFQMLQTQLLQSNNHLTKIIEELRIPETQRERRYHTEKGLDYLRMALKGIDSYFEDALDEFYKVIKIESKDYFSWFYIGYILLYSEKQIDIKNAIEAFKKYKYYALALRYKHNLLDEADFHLAECFYLQKEFDLAESQIKDIDNTKAKLLRIKYLSAGNKETNMIYATELLSELIKENPYIVLQVLNDDDILRNTYVIDFLESLRKKHLLIAKELLATIQSTTTKDKTGQTQEIICKAESLIQHESYFESIEAIYLLEEKYKWKSYTGEPFTSNLLDFDRYVEEFEEIARKIKKEKEEQEKQKILDKQERERKKAEEERLREEDIKRQRREEKEAKIIVAAIILFVFILFVIASFN